MCVCAYVWGHQGTACPGTNVTIKEHFEELVLSSSHEDPGEQTQAVGLSGVTYLPSLLTALLQTFMPYQLLFTVAVTSSGNSPEGNNLVFGKKPLA